MAEISVVAHGSGDVYLGLAGDEQPLVRTSVSLETLEEADALPALDGLVLDFDYYGRLVGIRATGSPASILPPALLDAALADPQDHG